MTKKMTPSHETAISNNQAIGRHDRFCFDCHHEVACFTKCCCDVDMYLYPYDIIRMKNKLDLTSDMFLSQYTYSGFRENPHFPNLMLKMTPDTQKACPFLSKERCSIYSDRPFSCRAYPLERAVGRIDHRGRKPELFFIAKHPYCLGHNEDRQWTVDEWTEVQDISAYNTMNDKWVEIDTILHNDPWQGKSIDNPAFKMAFMACYNIDEFKQFVLQSSFSHRFQFDPIEILEIMSNDERLLQFGFDWVAFFLTGKTSGIFNRLQATE